MAQDRNAGCDKICSLIIEYIDGELDEKTAELVAHHISECADCNKLYNDMKAVCDAAAESAYEVPEQLHSNIMAAVHAEKVIKNRRFMRHLTTWASAGVAAMLCVCVGISALVNNMSKTNMNAVSGEVAMEAADKSSGNWLASLLSKNNAEITQTEDGISAEGETLALSMTDGLYSGDASDENASIYSYASFCAERIVTASEKTSDVATPPEQGEVSTDAETAIAPSETIISESSAASPALNTPDAYDSTTGADNFSICGEWSITAGDGAIYTLSLTENGEFTLKRPDGTTVTGNYVIEDYFLTLTYSSESVTYLITESGSGTVLNQLTKNGLF